MPSAASFMRLVERLQADPTLPTIIRETAPKWSGLLARLSLVFHLVDVAERRRQGGFAQDRELCRVTVPNVTMAATYLRRIALPNLFRLGFETLPEEGAQAGHARWIAGHILAHQAQDITAREIGRAYRPLRGDPAGIAWAMDILSMPAGPSRPNHAGTASGGKSTRWCTSRFAAAAAQEKNRRAAVIETLKSKVADL